MRTINVNFNITLSDSELEVLRRNALIRDESGNTHEQAGDSDLIAGLQNLLLEKLQRQLWGGVVIVP